MKTSCTVLAWSAAACVAIHSWMTDSDATSMGGTRPWSMAFVAGSLGFAVTKLFTIVYAACCVMGVVPTAEEIISTSNLKTWTLATAGFWAMR